MFVTGNELSGRRIPETIDVIVEVKDVMELTAVGVNGSRASVLRGSSVRNDGSSKCDALTPNVQEVKCR